MLTAGTTTTSKIGTATVTKKAFAELMRVHTSTVSQWIRRRKLTPPALRPNGTAHVERARAQLSQTVGYGRMASPVSAAARSSTAEDATSVRLNRARSLVLEIAAESRQFDLAIAASVVISVEDARRATGRDLSDALGAVVSWVDSVAGVVLGAPDDRAATAALRLSFAKMWARVRGDRDQPEASATALGVAEITIRSDTAGNPAPAQNNTNDIRAAAIAAPDLSGTEAARPRRAETASERLSRLRCEREEAKAADALARLRARQAEHVAAEAWQAVVAQGFCAIRAQIERALPALVEAVRLAGDGRRAVLAAREWLNATRSKISRDAGKGVEK